MQESTVTAPSTVSPPDVDEDHPISDETSPALGDPPQRPVRDRKPTQRFGYHRPGEPMTYTLGTSAGMDPDIISRSDILGLIQQQLMQQQQQQQMNSMLMAKLLQQ